MPEAAYWKKFEKSLTETERREHDKIRKQEAITWRNFWVRVMKNRGMTNVDIARLVGLNESTVRSILKSQ